MGDHATTQAVDDLLEHGGGVGVAAAARCRCRAAQPAPGVRRVHRSRAGEAELAALFTPDATWDGNELGFGVGEGPEAIAATVLSHFDPAMPMMHVPGPPLLVALSDDAVRGVSWCIATRSSGEGTGMGGMIWFQYHDEFRRDDGAWRFRSRKLLPRFRG